MANYFRVRGKKGRQVASWLLRTPGPSNHPTYTPNPCTTSRVSNAHLSMAVGDAGDDPWSWDVDRVVRELCTDQRSWPSKSASQRMPDPTSLEKRLREHEVDGPTFLTSVNETVIRETLGVQKLREIDTINHAVMALRSMSTEYKDWQRKYGKFGDGSSKRSISPEQLQRSNTSPSPSLVFANKRRKLDQEVEDQSMHLPIVTDSIPTAADSLIQLPMVDGPLLEHDDRHGNEGLGDAPTNGKKRKRIAPDLVTSVIDPNRNREIPTQADMVRQNDPHNVEPGVVYRDDDGKKRLVPLSTSTVGQEELARRHQEQLHLSSSTLQQGGKTGLEAAEKLLQVANFNKAQPESLSVGYLGKSKLTVDKIFYGNTALGGELLLDDDGKEFAHAQGHVSNARRLYVGGLMKHYLRVQPQVVIRKNTMTPIIQPYRIRLVPEFATPSLTVFRANGNGKISAMRESLKRWPEVNGDAPKSGKSVLTDGERSANFHLSEGESIGGPTAYDNWDPSLHLEKYMHLEGGDEVLPLYGDSDSDGEYDIDTWREIEEELGALEQPRVSLKRQQISQDEISQAIDEGMALMIIKWSKEKLPKRQLKAWKLWKKCRRDKSFKREQIRKAQQHLNRINNERLVKMRLEILSEVWTSQKQVRKQSRIMEQSIFDREDSAWQLSVLESKTEPPRPHRDGLTIKSKKVSHEYREDEESIGTETEAEISEDSLDEFIVNDDVESVDDRLHIADDLVTVQSDVQDEDGEAPMDMDSSDEESTPGTPSNPTSRSPPIRKQQDTKQDILDAADYDNAELSSSASSPGTRSEAELPSLPFRGITNSPSAEVIDLTLLSSDASAAEFSQFKKVIDLSTPEKPQKALKFKVNRTRPLDAVKSESLLSKSRNTMITISDSEEVSLPSTPPPLHDFRAIANYPYRLWAKSGDQKRFLIAFFQQMRPEICDTLRDLFESVEADQMWANTMIVMESFPKPQKVKGMDRSTFKSYTGVARLFEMFLDGEFHSLRREGISQNMVSKLKASSGTFPTFHEFCLSILSALHRGNMHEVFRSPDSAEEDGDEDGDEEEIRTARRRKLKIPDASETEADVPDHLTPHRFRKKKINENAQARELRAQDQERLKEQDERRQILQRKLNQYGGESSSEKVIINDAKFEGEGFVYVSENIAKRIKPHQINGVRFLWNQIVQGEQGCLLAHTMGLGKTMQTITLLVAIAEAAKHHDMSISSQIPQNLLQSRTLILCPPTLIDNWMDELLIWAPEGVLGDLRKVDSTIKNMNARINIINSWYHSGGVLIMGYEMFRLLILNKATKVRGPPLDQDAHNEVLKYLQQGPHIVIADEAHKMKNANSSVTEAASMFATRSRIALTGSPLANNIEEYHTMIQWVAPNYLGPISEFKAKYVEPIQQGLYEDSTSYERRKSLKMLGVLKEDLAPKVHRADMSVLRDDLMPKTEFVITVPLTQIQMQAYSHYVRFMLEKSSDQLVNKEGKIQQTTLWHWLGILSLLCNHPESFKAKLLQRKDDAKNALKKDVNLSDEDVIPGTAPVWKVGVSKELIEKELELFAGANPVISAFENSNKIVVLLQILDASRDEGDKVLIFSQSLDTLDFLEKMCERTNRKYARLDGATPMANRQGLTKKFNTGDTEIYLISTTAGGLGLNLPGANRVVIFDFKFNPIHEEQAIGRAYRIGQKKPVFVYRFLAGGTFEGVIHNTTIFKKQLASRVIDKKNVIREAKKRAGDYLFIPEEVKQQDLSGLRGMDPVLDKILDDQTERPIIRAIATTDIFERHDDDALTAEEQREVEQLISDEKLKRSNYGDYLKLVQARNKQARVAPAAGTSGTSGGGALGPGRLAPDAVSRQNIQTKTPVEIYREMQAIRAPYQPAPPLVTASPPPLVQQTPLLPSTSSAVGYFPSQGTKLMSSALGPREQPSSPAPVVTERPKSNTSIPVRGVTSFSGVNGVVGQAVSPVSSHSPGSRRRGGAMGMASRIQIAMPAISSDGQIQPIRGAGVQQSGAEDGEESHDT